MDLNHTFFPHSQRARINGETVYIGFQRLRLTNGGPLWPYFASCVATVYDSSGNVAAGPLRCNPEPSSDYSTVQCTYSLTTGPNGIITQPGTYRVVYTVLLSDLTNAAWEQNIVINPRPY